MQTRSKLNAFAALALAATFYWFFMFNKHDARVASIVAFADDPYDAGGSYCLIVSLLLAVISLTRAFRRYPSGVSEIGSNLLARTQAAVATGILITLLIDSIAMVRHTSQWVSKPGSTLLWELVGMMAVLSAGMLAMIRMGLGSRAKQEAGRWWKAFGSLVTAALAAAVFPESLVNSLSGHLVAILLGFMLVAAPQAMLAAAMVPCRFEVPRRVSRRWVPWSFVALFGVALGASVLAAEWSDGTGGMPARQMLIVAAFFLVAGVGVLVVGFRISR